VVVDFDAAQNDRLTISAAGFGGGLVAGTAPRADQLVLGLAATEAHGQFLYAADTGQLRWDADGTGSGRAVNIAVLQNLGLHPASLLASSFEIIARRTYPLSVNRNID
jgi:Ca2+-binding RTX toxin-like protein